MPELNQIEGHSEEVQELMGKIPGRILRWGLTVIFAIMFLIIAGSYFIRFPEKVTAPLIITTYNTPVVLKAKTAGKLEHILVNNEQTVYKESVIAVIENSANYIDILKVDSLLNFTGNEVDWDEIVTSKKNIKAYSLGSLQNSYGLYQQKFKQFRHYLKQNLIPLKIELLGEQIRYKKEILKKHYSNMS